MHDDEKIREKLAKRSQYTGRMNALETWEAQAGPGARTTFEAYVRNWLLMKADGHMIGWKAFAELCAEDIRGFHIGPQGLKGALGERIKRL